jgi:hypothetical protein
MTHELRPYEYVVDYKRAIIDMRMGNDQGFRTGADHHSFTAQNLAEHSRVVSASPFRASVRMTDEKQ